MHLKLLLVLIQTFVQYLKRTEMIKHKLNFEYDANPIKILDQCICLNETSVLMV